MPPRAEGQPRSTLSSKIFKLTDETTDRREVNPTGSALCATTTYGTSDVSSSEAPNSSLILAMMSVVEIPVV